MTKKNLEAKVIKAVLNLEKKVIDINNVLRDINMKLCHIIKYKGKFWLVRRNLKRRTIYPLVRVGYVFSIISPLWAL